MDFSKLPINTRRQYVRAVDKSGTDIFIPVDSISMKHLKERQAELQDHLAKQPMSKLEHMKPRTAEARAELERRAKAGKRLTDKPLV